MYYPVGWNKVLKLDLKPSAGELLDQSGVIISVSANSERELYLILTPISLHLWCPKPAVEIACHRRSVSSIESLGPNKTVAWKTDSSVIVIATDRDQLLFYQLRQRVSDSGGSALLLYSFPSTQTIYRLRTDTKSLKNVNGNLGKAVLDEHNQKTEQVPALTIYTFGKLDLASVGVSCLMAAEEELIVGARDGSFYGIHWNGNIDEKFPWSLKKDEDGGSAYIIDLKFSSVLSGFALVFSDGRVAFLPLMTPEERNGSRQDKIGPRSCRLSYLLAIDNGICVEINHKNRLMAIGLNNSEVIVCNIEESNSSLVVNHKLSLNAGEFPNMTLDLGSVKCMRYSPDSFALATAWENGHFAIWSVFGSLLFSSLQWQLDCNANKSYQSLIRVSSLAWGREGHGLWMSIMRDDLSKEGSETKSEITVPITEDDKSLNEVGQHSETGSSLTSGVTSLSDPLSKDEVIIIPFAHSTLSSSPHLTCSSDSVVLLSEERLYIGSSVPHKAEFDHWFVIDIPKSYLLSSYPIRYATVDRNCNKVAIAGSHGFALYSITSSKWKFFTKKSDQSGFSICGDIIWWNEYLIMSCYNIEKEICEIRAYSAKDILDDDDSVIQPIPMEIIRMSVFENRLLVLYGDGTFGMFMLNLRRKPKKVNLQISAIENLVISNLQANPYCISSIALTRLHFKNDRFDDSILLNSCGKLSLLEREIPPSPTSPDVAFKAVSVIATNVEHFWISPEISSASEMSYFRKSLWLSCGGSKTQLQVWLPLLKDKSDAPTDLYVPDRIMLPIRCDIYPLAIRSSTPNETGPDDAIILGAESDILYRDSELFERIPFSTVKRQCRIYLHRVLRELLLNQHLGYYARKIAESCQYLPYFAHCFELLLHEVLEEEATSPVPLPDPMLPQVVEFIKKFPVYLETVIHCARKSELSMWSHLFDERAVGNPRRLFRECLDKKELDTASSCLIILQSFDKNIVSQKMVKELIKAASEDPKFKHLVEDLENFLLRAEIECINVSSGTGSPT